MIKINILILYRRYKMETFLPNEMRHYRKLLEAVLTEESVGMTPTHALSDKELDQFQQMPADKKKIASPDQQHDLDVEASSRYVHEELTDEGNEFSGAREDAIKAGKNEFTVDGKTYQVTGDEEMEEAAGADNFTIDDIKHLEKMQDFGQMKMFAKKLLSTPSDRPIKPQKIIWLTQRIDALRTPAALIKMMYDLLLSGEGHSVIGSQHSMDPNSYRSRFGENSVEEGMTTNQFEEPKSSTSHAKPDWSKEGSTSQNYTQDDTKKWDSYMSNEAKQLGTTSDDYTSAEQDAWDEKGSNESMEWEDITLETTRDFNSQWENVPTSVGESEKVAVNSNDNTMLARLRELSGLK